jgi:flagellar biosynthesis/type III secretory pathway protein FliH
MNEAEIRQAAYRDAAMIAQAFQRGQEQMGEEEGWDEGLRAGHETSRMIAAALNRIADNCISK